MCRHECIVQVLALSECSDHSDVVVELMRGGELFDYICCKVAIPEAECAPIFRRIVRAVEHLHSLGVVHRDIKPENILVGTDYEEDLGVKVRCHNKIPPAFSCNWIWLQLTDFGLAVVMEDGELLRGDVGSPGYAAPEICLDKAPYDEKVDIFSLGVLLFVM